MSGMGRARLPIDKHVGPGISDVLVAQAEVRAKVEGPVLEAATPGLVVPKKRTDHDENAQVIGEAISIVGQTVKDGAGFSGKWYGGNLAFQGTWAPPMVNPEIGPKIVGIQVPTLSPAFPILSPPSPVVGGGA